MIQGCNAVLETMTAPSASDACESGELAKGQQTAAGTVPSSSFPRGPQGYTKAAEYHLVLLQPGNTKWHSKDKGSELCHLYALDGGDDTKSSGSQLKGEDVCS